MKVTQLLKFIFQYKISKNRLLIKYGTPTVTSIADTLNQVVVNNKSIARFGDGEFNLIAGKGNGFQDYNEVLANKLKYILSEVDNSNCLVCLPDVFDSDSLNMRFKPKLVWANLFCYFYPKIYDSIRKDKTYYNSFITRPYMDFKNKFLSDTVFNEFMSFFKDKKILIIEGEGTKFGYQNKLLDSCESVNRVITSNKNAFDHYTKIVEEIHRLVDDFDIILIALGPTATVLAFELSLNVNKPIIDIGHLDIEFEWYTRKTRKKTTIKNKNVNELGTNSSYLSGDEHYQQSIIGKIGID
ncbi:TPA: GT-D fold domain-containing glycosyltransferase [Photobacterium damselae]